MMAELTTVPKGKLLARMRHNQEAHRAKYEVAMERYRLAAIDALNEQLRLAHAREPFSLSFSLPEPKDYSGQYEKAIEFVDWNTDEEIVLDRESFNRYVMDQWDWVRAFLASTASYLGQ